MACPAILPGDAFLSGLLNYVDCQAQMIGQNGYQALAMPGSPVAMMLTALLTIFIALFGYRLLLGHVPELRDGVIAVVKIGIVLVLATSWPAFRTLAYDVTMHAPAELATSIGSSAALPGAGGGLVARLQRIDNGFAELIVLGTGRPDGSDAMSEEPTPRTAAQQQQQMQRLQQLSGRLAWNPEKDASRVASARTVYLTATITAFASVRLIAGLLLALGPLFALFLLFDATRGLFEGWVRGLAGAALGAVSTAILLGVQLAMMEPWLATVLAERRADVPTPSVPVEGLVIALVFALTMLAALIATAKVAAGFRLPEAWRLLPSRLAGTVDGASSATYPIATGDRAVVDQRSRALAVADAVAATQRRELMPVAGLGSAGGARTHGIFQAVSRDRTVAAIVPLGQSYRRRTGTRVSAGASRRDRKS
ncbi:type IV secretion system protein [Sphingomonas sp. PB4P5]|uniref:type IV secretion system protein n=1 Tax=Parasphingomonas puruogangriensis TaxID=3096155 RepID=UPI002FC5E78E